MRLSHNLALLAILLAAVPAFAQQAPSSRRWESVALARIATSGGVFGAQLEYGSARYLAPWGSIRYGTFQGCSLAGPCIDSGTTLTAGLRLRLPLSKIEPYVSFGAGVLIWEDRTNEFVANGNIGFAVNGLGRIRPRGEYGVDRHGTGYLIGIGIVF